jgi:hypothetical protein
MEQKGRHSDLKGGTTEQKGRHSDLKGGTMEQKGRHSDLKGGTADQKGRHFDLLHEKATTFPKKLLRQDVKIKKLCLYFARAAK